jgi:hypothetical protein
MSTAPNIELVTYDPTSTDPDAGKTEGQKDASKKVRALVKTYSFIRAPGTILMHLKGKVSAFMANRIEADIASRFGDLTVENLDLVMMAIVEELEVLAAENRRKQEEEQATEAARIEAKKAELQAKKEAERAAKKSAKKK